MVLDPNFRPKKVLVIGLGAAAWLKGLIDFDFVERVTIVELSHELYEAVRAFSHPAINRSFDDPRVDIQMMDGRRFVQRLPHQKKYDLIQIGILTPNMSGAANLYTKEFISTLKKHLSPHGYLLTMVVKSLPVTFLEVFKYGYNLLPGANYIYTDSKIILPDSKTINVPGAFWEQAHITHPQITAVQFQKANGAINSDDCPKEEYFFLRKVVLPKLQRFWPRSTALFLAKGKEGYHSHIVRRYKLMRQ
jgi:spermidine synthase